MTACSIPGITLRKGRSYGKVLFKSGFMELEKKEKEREKESVGPQYCPRTSMVKLREPMGQQRDIAMSLDSSYVLVVLQKPLTNTPIQLALEIPEVLPRANEAVQSLSLQPVTFAHPGCSYLQSPKLYVLDHCHPRIDIDQQSPRVGRTTVSHHVGALNQTWVFCKSKMCS